jgi:hypothetical protein
MKNEQQETRGRMRLLLHIATTSGLFVCVTALAIGLGMLLTRNGMFYWDDEYQLLFNQWLMFRFGLDTVSTPPTLALSSEWYGPLVELMIGIASLLLRTETMDVYWMRHTFTFAMYPVGLLSLWLLLRACNISKANAMLSVACIFGIIRLGGHSLFNAKDAPAALLFLLCSIGCWLLLRQVWDMKASVMRRSISAIFLGACSVVPFLARPPLLLHYLLCLGVLALLPLQRKNQRWTGAGLWLLTFASGAAAIIGLYPPIRDTGVSGIGKALETFASYSHHTDFSHIFDAVYFSLDLPWWYPLFWLVVIVNPLVFIAVSAGWCLLLRRAESVSTPFAVQIMKRVFPLSLELWLWLIIVFSWGAVFVTHPNLYDEERHILFLYPPVILLGSFGLYVLRGRAKVLFSILLIAASLQSYVGWGRYSYIYSNPMLRAELNELSGDYWGLCISAGLLAATEHVPPDTILKIDGPLHLAVFQERWLKNPASPVFASGYSLRLTDKWPHGEEKFVVLWSNSFRSWDGHRIHEDMKTGTATLLWSTYLPNGDAVCRLVGYGLDQRR